jgi:hypothetical protein
VKGFRFHYEGFGQYLYNFSDIENVVTKQQYSTPSPQAPELDKPTEIFVAGKQQQAVFLGIIKEIYVFPPGGVDDRCYRATA